jgi:hypothetical protein
MTIVLAYLPGSLLAIGAFDSVARVHDGVNDGGVHLDGRSGWD